MDSSLFTKSSLCHNPKGIQCVCVCVRESPCSESGLCVCVCV